MFLALNEDSDAVRQDIEYFMTDLDAAIDGHIAIETHVWIRPDRVTAGWPGLDKRMVLSAKTDGHD